MALRKGMQELKDLDVERVDGVDKPATGRSFLLFKAEDGAAEQVLKGYAMVATAGDAVLKAIRTDKHASVSVKSAVAINGLAQVLGQDAVFLQKGVPTQPYEVTEPNVDTRGPADEKLGAGFVARSAGMVGKAELKLKAGAVPDEPKEPEEDEEMPPWMKSIAEGQTAMTKAIGEMAGVLKSIAEMEKAGIEKVEKMAGAGDEPKGEPFVVKKIERPESKQGKGEEKVRKDMDPGYEPRFASSFSDVVFGGGRGR